MKTKKTDDHSEPTWENQLWHTRKILTEKGREALDNPSGMIGRTCGCGTCFTCAAAHVVAEHDWKHRTGTHWGTCHFRSRDAAIKYFAHQGNDAYEVDRKIEAGEIAYGLPSLKEGQRLLLNPDEGRYFIQESGA